MESAHQRAKKSVRAKWKRPARAPKKKNSIGSNEKAKSLMRHNIPNDAIANANDTHQFIPVSEQANKANALAEDVAKPPEEDQPQAKKDQKALIGYSKSFDPSARIFNMNWSVRGIKTHLRHHQVCRPGTPASDNDIRLTTRKAQSCGLDGKLDLGCVVGP